MVLESTVVCFDNGDFMRNGDFVPTRMQAQQEAVNLLIQCKLRSNPENVVGLLSMAPKIDVQMGLTQDSNKLMAKLHQIQIKGLPAFTNGIKTAQLVLKHRQNRNHKTRIVVFVGSPLEDAAEELVSLAKKLKKDKFLVDIVSFGEENENNEKLNAFINTINGTDTGSRLVSVPAGSNLQEVLLQSAILRNDEGEAPAVTFGTGGGFDFGIDANEDPELAMALRVSLEEQRQRQEQQALFVDQQPAVLEPISVPEMQSMTEEEQMEMALRMSIMPAEEVTIFHNEPDKEPMEGVQETEPVSNDGSESTDRKHEGAH